MKFGKLAIMAAIYGLIGTSVPGGAAVEDKELLSNRACSKADGVSCCMENKWKGLMLEREKPRPHAKVPAKAGAFSPQPLDVVMFFWSGKRDSNPRPSAWEADTLPLSYSRFCYIQNKSELLLSIRLVY